MSRRYGVVRRGWLCVGLALGLVLGAAASGFAQVKSSTAQERNIARVVSTMLKSEHLTKHPFDDEIVQRSFTQYLKMLDPLKLYFYQSDVDALKARQNQIASVPKGDLSFGNEVFKVFLGRVDERIKAATAMLGMKHDFTVDEEIVTDKDAVTYAKSESETNDRWRKRVKYDMLLLRADRIEKSREKPDPKEEKDPSEAAPKTAAEQEKDDLDRLRRRYQMIAKRWHQIDADELLEMYLTAISNSFDPHTSYMSPQTVENFNILMRLNLEGIGASLRGEDGYTIVEKLIPGGAAALDGKLKVKHRIIGVGQGDEGPIQDVVEMRLNDVVKLIRGKAGTVVRLDVTSPHGGEKKIVRLVRKKVELKDSEARAKVFEAGKNADGKPCRVGLIDLPSFYMDMEGARAGKSNFKSTTRDVRRILRDFNQERVDAVILDLRHNGGGSLQEAINLTGLFIEDGPVVQVKDSDGTVRPYKDGDSDILWKGPLVVLISKFSASASEILAGAIQDYHRGLIVGDRSTHGKGTVQNLADLGESLFGRFGASNLGSLKITIQQFYRPDGDSTQQRGVLSDIEWPSITTHMDVGEADLDYPIPFDRVQASPHADFQLVDKDLASQLGSLSKERRAKVGDFKKLEDRIARYQDRKKRKAAPLNEKKFMQWADVDADKEEEKKMEEMAEGGTGEIKRTFHVDEALAITADYLHLLAKRPKPARQHAAVQPAAPSEESRDE